MKPISQSVTDTWSQNTRYGARARGSSSFDVNTPLPEDGGRAGGGKDEVMRRTRRRRMMMRKAWHVTTI